MPSLIFLPGSAPFRLDLDFDTEERDDYESTGLFSCAAFFKFHAFILRADLKYDTRPMNRDNLAFVDFQTNFYHGSTFIQCAINHLPGSAPCRSHDVAVHSSYMDRPASGPSQLD